MTTFNLIYKNAFKTLEINDSFTTFPKDVNTVDFFKYLLFRELCFHADDLLEYNFDINQFYKFYSLKKMLTNDYIPENIKERLIDFFSICQRHYHKLCRFVYRYKLKKATVYDYDTDFCSNPLQSLNNRIKITLYISETKTIYNFRLSDMIGMINTSLSYAPLFFTSPKPIKNPFTNVEFKRNNLYNIYFKIKDSSLEMPILFYLYYKSNFNIKRYFERNKALILDEYIKIQMNSISDYEKRCYVNNMVEHYDIWVYPGFPTEQLVKVFDKIIVNYIYTCYSIQPTTVMNNERVIKGFIRNLTSLYPFFGRKIIFKYNAKKIDNLKKHNIAYFPFNKKRNLYFYFICDRDIDL